MTRDLSNDPPGVLADHQIEVLFDRGVIERGAEPQDGSAIQPASLDLSLGAEAFRIRASFLPGEGDRVDKVLPRFQLQRFRLDSDKGTLLERGGVYLVRVQESLRLPPDISANANPKSSSGRLDIFTRLISDHATSFDLVPAGYQGPLYVEICPRSFPIILRKGARLNQIRFRKGHVRRLSDQTLTKIHHEQQPLIHNSLGETLFRDGLCLSANLRGEGPRGNVTVGFRARSNAGAIDLDARAMERVDHWERLHERDAQMVLDPDQFYILASRERLALPDDLAAEMVPFDHFAGEFRVHYAGFFDPGFGRLDETGNGSPAVLEVRCRDVPFVLRHGQMVARLRFERLSALPLRPYGQRRGSHYQTQDLTLAKQFLNLPNRMNPTAQLTLDFERTAQKATSA